MLLFVHNKAVPVLNTHWSALLKQMVQQLNPVQIPSFQDFRNVVSTGTFHCLCHLSMFAHSRQTVSMEGIFQ